MTEQSAQARVTEKLRAFYEGLPEDEKKVIARMMATSDSDVSGFTTPEGLDAAGITAPSFEAVFASFQLEAPNFERIASLADAVEGSVQLETDSSTANLERNA
jgi:hypothetical protein